ncbi:MAG: thioredoxin family protein [Phycisphaerae bacterium]
MTGKHALRLVAAGLALLLLAGGSAAKGVKVGEVAPDWSGIIGVDDKKHGLGEYKDAKIVVLVFTCNHCPFAKAYQDRLIQIQKDYGPKDVQVVAVNVNNLPADRLPAMKERAKEKKYNFPYLYDPTQKIGHDYGAKVTPHVFILGKATEKGREVEYIGAIDNNMKADKADKHYVRDALDALLAGKEPPVEEAKPFGCSVKYEKK